MTHTSQEPATQPESPQQTARIIPFDGQSEMQRAVQRRAQEFIDAQAVKPKVSPVRRIVTFAIALIPVGLTVAGFLVAVQAVRVITSLYATTPPTSAAPVVEQEPPPIDTQSEPGVVILVPEKLPEPPAGSSEQPRPN